MEAFSAVWAIIYLLFAFFVLQRELAHGKVAKHIILYSSVAIVLELLNAIKSIGWLGLLGKSFWEWQRPLGILVMGIVFLSVTRTFLDSPKRQRWWVVLAAAWFLVIYVFSSGLFQPLLRIEEGLWNIFISGGILIGWLFLLTATVTLLVVSFVKSTTPLHRNRIAFWGFAVFVISSGDIFVFLRQDIIGSLLRIAGLFMAGYVVFFQDLPDLSGSIQRLPLTIYKTVVAFVLYATVLSMRLPGFSHAQDDIRWLEYGMKALILVVGVNPLLLLFNKFVDHSISDTRVSRSSIVREYNLAIAQIVDLPHLAEVAAQEISQVFRIRHARLYLVDYLDEEKVFRLRKVSPPVENSANPGDAVDLSLKGPVVDQFNRLQKPLFQYDLDFSPSLFPVIRTEKAWFSEQKMDIYIPICTLDSWIGLLGLGPKLSGERYTREDIDLLSTLAEQTVIALQNARLVDRLIQTQNMLEAANLKLRSIDVSKSAFISVVTHELRTPMVNIGFSLQVLEMYGKDHFLPEHRELLDQLSQSVRAARNLIDNLIAYASFLNEQIQLNFEKFELKEPLRNQLQPLREQAELKGLYFQVEFPDGPLSVIADKKFILDAVQHLVVNAIKFTQTGSIWISCWSMEDVLCFEVQDTGLGIPASKLTDIWDAFTQASSDSLRRGVEGLGLGLALVKMIIENHGGYVWVESILHSGSFFGFQIPVDGPSHPIDEEKAKRYKRLAIKRNLNWQVRNRSSYESEK